ncbi:hypothetical protein SLEP1_g8381 [Rubroshorea leprosula]|uniref:Uncharacterized protein n=1 Tax=Rubroshorea leprosula TaxID=152421 RepID=A0AAV5ICF6_9ROSI|nr:hypothetical protein SLEP1_g8381 [Rubroshorea leprosula]
MGFWCGVHMALAGHHVSQLQSCSMGGGCWNDSGACLDFVSYPWLSYCFFILNLSSKNYSYIN